MNTRSAGGSINDAAAYWLVALKSPDVPPQMLKRWEKWISVPTHKHAFDEAQKLWERLDEVPAPTWPTDAEVTEDTYDGSVPVWVFEEKREAVSRQRHHVRHSWIGLAAVVGLIAMGLGLVKVVLESSERRSPGMTVFETKVTQHESVVLTDGSQIQMGGRTAVTANITREVRLVVMDRGEAIFTIAHDSQRPFRVLAGGGMITAIGTEFNVRRLDDVVVVTVTEGTVEVAPASAMTAGDGRNFPHGQRVTRGETISYDADGKLGDVRKADLGVTMSWRNGRLQYRSEPLNRVVQDINRYSRKSVTIADAAAGTILYSGTVFERDIDDWLAALDKLFPELQVTQPDQQHVVIRTRVKQRDVL